MTEYKDKIIYIYIHTVDFFSSFRFMPLHF